MGYPGIHTIRGVMGVCHLLVDAQRHALGHLAHRPPGWFRDKDTPELRRSIERLGGVSQDLESIQERARLLQEEIAGRLGKATNQNLYRFPSHGDFPPDWESLE